MNIFGLNHLCLLCHTAALKNYALCKDCEKILPRAPCLSYPDFDKILVLFDYCFPVNYLITQLKFKHQLPNADLLGKLLTLQIPKFYAGNQFPERIIPVPLHPERLRERGFNQALEIAKPISKSFKIPIEKFAFCRKKNTVPQSSLPKEQRLKNIKNAFHIQKAVHYTHAAIVDDVLTTGETLKEFAKTLRKNGIQKIDVWCCAQTGLP